MSNLVTGVDFATVFVDDFDAAKQFYGDVLGLEKSVEYQGFAGCEFETGNLTLQIMDSAALGREFTASDHPIALHVEDFEAAKGELESRGVSFIHELDSGVCNMGFFADPSGNTYCLHNRYAPKN
jgi:catechol 2,3-dioxygenase-like lactoylglutathione lyase family enzyme